MGCEEFCGADCGRSLRGLTEMNGGSRSEDLALQKLMSPQLGTMQARTDR